ncbi:MAG: glutathione S-transferase family protein [bacterium]|nr:glutathione S-transferase family protein [bacterium]MCP5070537.1 glutathione S-transferase family protein [bacterium]
MPILHGANASPFVRKVRVALSIKGIEYEANPIVPFGVSEEYLEKSPLGKIPCYEDGELTLPDSSVIVAYLEKKQPEPAIYPSDPATYGRALWLEEYADTKCAENVGRKIFFPRVITAKFLKGEVDEEAVERAIAEDLPPIFDYLEKQAPDSGDAIVGGRFSNADIAIGCQFVNLGLAGVEVDASRWPRLAAYVAAVLANPHFKPLIEEEKAQLAAM